MKRLAALLLAAALLCALSLGASAAGFTGGFEDVDDIKNLADVAMLTDLQIISGYDDNTFRPIKTITRAETAKIIASIKTPMMAMNKQTDYFSDTAGHWASTYINFCAEKKIIVGDGKGTFRPNDSVTARELAKMLLVALGHDPARYGGAEWTKQIDADAKETGIYNGYTRELSQYISRDDACLLINNALKSKVILSYDAAGNPVYALDAMMSPQSMLEYRYGLELVSGVVQANAVVDLRTGEQGTDSTRIHISGYTRDFVVASEDIASDTSLLGRKVWIYAQLGTSYNIAYGMPSLNADEIYITITREQLDTLRSAGSLRVTDTTKIYLDYTEVTAAAFEALAPDASVLVIDNQRDGVIDSIFLTSPEVTR